MDARREQYKAFLQNLGRSQQYKAFLVNLARTHMNTRAGTPEELALSTQLDDTVIVLLEIGVSEAEIRRLINEGQAYTNGRIPPPFATRRYMTPAHAEELGIMRERARYNPDGANAAPRPAQRPVAAPRPAQRPVAALRPAQRPVAAPRPAQRQLEAPLAVSLVNLARTHMNTRAGTPEELALWSQLDETVSVLLEIGVSEAEIRRLIYEGQAYTDGRRPPPFPTRRYATPAEAQELEIIRERAENAYAEQRPAAAAAAAAALPPYLNMEDEDIDSKDLDEYKDMLKCPFCLSNIKDVRLSPCGHMMCKSCLKNCLAQGENKCPVCRQRFTSYDKVYYSKYLKYKNKYLQLKTKSF
jgi:hypothetical protein